MNKPPWKGFHASIEPKEGQSMAQAAAESVKAEMYRRLVEWMARPG